MPLVKVPLDCKGCGACCYHLLVPVEEGSEVPEHLIEVGESKGLEMKQREDGSCIALDCNTLLCTIYDQRPAVCREFGPDENAMCLDRVHARQQIVMDEAAEGVEALIQAAADFAMCRGFAPTMRPVHWPSGTQVTVYLSRTLMAPDIRMQIRDESLVRMRGALSDVSKAREVSQLQALHDWAVERKKAETEHRPVVNIHRRTLVATWDQIIQRLDSMLPHEEPLEGEELDA
jgi:Fe-S-cluster containining protein